MKKCLILCCVLLLHCDAVGAAELLIEAERFAQYGGWVLDQQFMDEMGSPFLLAHGLGKPVTDAVTIATFPTPGTYRVWVRTRDWVGPWKGTQVPVSKRALGSPGLFQVLFNGQALATLFGVEGKDWFWQDGGTVEISQTTVALSLHDLTGFEGRCDSLYFTTDLNFIPPHDVEALRPWRRQLSGLDGAAQEAGHYDLVVVGGGMAGMCASLLGARLGLEVALIQDRPVLGGNNSGEVRVWLNGGIKREPYPRVGDTVQELEPERRAHGSSTNFAELYEDEKRLALFQSEPNLSLFTQCRMNEVEMEGDLIRAVIAEHIVTGERFRFTGATFADCTGDGCVGFLAGADYDITLTGHMGRCNLWNVRDTGQRQSFPSCSWALNLTNKPFPSRLQDLGVWYWESGFDHDPFAKGEYIRDWNFRATYGAWDAIKNTKKLYPNHELRWIAHISGKRESRRLLGDVILTKEDLVQSVSYPDAFVPTTWSIDLHLPHPSYVKGFEGDAFISKAHFTGYPKPYWVPYRCLYSRNVNNLFMAGRDISVTHEALGAVRVMRTGGMMGEIVALAASLCKKYDTLPREVYRRYLGQLKNLVVGHAVTSSRWINHIHPNLAYWAQITVSSNYDTQKYPPSHIADGRMDRNDNDQRWLSSRDTETDTVTFVWDQPRLISACRIVSGWNSGTGPGDPIQDFVLEAKNESGWAAIEETRTRNNSQTEWITNFPARQVQQLRLLVTKTPSNIARIWEIELFHPAADLSYDGRVGNEDLKLLTDAWLQRGKDIPADLDRSQCVDGNDLSTFGLFWRWPQAK